jgi:hypothetical protein
MGSHKIPWFQSTNQKGLKTPATTTAYNSNSGI